MAFLADESLFDGLPHDGKLAFIEMMGRIEALHATEHNFDRSDYVNLIRLFSSVFRVEMESEYWRDKPPHEIYLKENVFDLYRAHLAARRLEWQLIIGREKSLGALDAVKLSDESKEKIRMSVSEILSLLDGLHLDKLKLDLLRRKILAFSEELERDETRLTAFLSSTLQVAKASGKAAKELEPVAKLLDKIQKMMGEGAAEQPALPSWENRDQLPSPPKQIEDHSAAAE